MLLHIVLLNERLGRPLPAKWLVMASYHYRSPLYIHVATVEWKVFIAKSTLLLLLVVIFPCIILMKIKEKRGGNGARRRRKICLWVCTLSYRVYLKQSLTFIIVGEKTEQICCCWLQWSTWQEGSASRPTGLLATPQATRSYPAHTTCYTGDTHCILNFTSYEQHVSMWRYLNDLSVFYKQTACLSHTHVLASAELTWGRVTCLFTSKFWRYSHL